MPAINTQIGHLTTFNEEEVGRAVNEGGAPREEIIVTSKLWLSHYGYDRGKPSHDPEAPGMGERLLNAFPVED